MVYTAARLHHRTILRIEGQARRFFKYINVCPLVTRHGCSCGDNGDGLFSQLPPKNYTFVVNSKMGDLPIHHQKISCRQGRQQQ